MKASDRRIKWRSLRFWLPALLSLLAIGGNLIMYVVETRIENAEFDTKAAANGIMHTAELQSNAERWVLRNDMAMAQAVFGEHGIAQDVKAALLLDAANIVLASTRHEHIGQPLGMDALGLAEPDAEQLRAAMETVRQSGRGSSLFTNDRNGLIACIPTALPPQPGELGIRHDGLVVAVYDLRPGRAIYLADLQRQFLFYSGCILFLILVLGIGLHFLITRRLERLKSAMDDFAAGKGVTESRWALGDEISLLGAGFNDMAVAISRTMKEIQDLYDHAPCGYHSLDASGTVVRINETELSWLGYGRDEIVGKLQFSDLLTARSIETFRRELPGLEERGWLGNLDLEMARVDGSVLPVVLNAKAGRDANGKLLMSRWAAVDITERKEAERSIALLNLALDNVHEAAYLIGEDAKFLYVNGEACRALGYSREELLQLDVPAVDPGIPAARWPEHWRELKAKHTLTFEGWHKTKDGRTFPAEIAANHFEADGRSYNLALVRDITERRRTEEQQRRYSEHLEEAVQQRTAELVMARDAAEAANKAKSVFLASMSHELRTPLNAILGFSAIVRGEPDLTKENYERLDIINRNGEHLLKLINDVLEIAKIETGRLHIETAPFDLGAMIRDVMDMIWVRAAEKGLELQVKQSPAFPRYIKGDEAHLRQVLANLAGNAVKFTQAGGVTVRLDTKRGAPHHLIMEVEDTGPGINPEDQRRLFQPFVQLGDAGAREGTGLGLAISRQYVERMGGAIGMTSTPGKGSVFRVELPVELASAAEVRQRAAESRGVAGLAPGTPRHRILIAEDQRDSQFLLSQMMTGIGLDARTADDGEQCVKLFQEWHPHLIWMDWRMPVVDGLEATRRIRGLPGGRKVKIVAVTASVFMEQQQQVLDAGVDDFLRKPYRLDEIYNCLARQLGVKYLYKTAEAEVAAPVQLTPAMLTVLPSAVRRELESAVESLDSERIRAAVVQVSEIDGTLAGTLSRLSDDFQYAAILAALAAEAGQSGASPASPLVASNA